MRILLFRPRPSNETIGLQHLMLLEPLELEVLGACTRPEDEVVIIDLLLERASVDSFILRHAPDVVGVTGYITNVPAMIDICRRAKRLLPRVRTIVGGVHVEVCPEHLDDPVVDFRVVRNAVSGFRQLLEHIRGHGSVPAGVLTQGQNIARSELPAFDFDYVRPRRQLTQHYRHRYFYISHDKVALVKTAFGCPYRCSFCFCRVITDDHYHARPLPDVIDELAEIEEHEIYIVDDDFFISRAQLNAFIDAIKSRGIHKSYLVYGRADFIAKNPDLIERFKRHGLRTVIIGIESFRPEDLKRYNKRGDVEANREAIKVCNRLGVDVFATMVLGPDWSHEDFELHARVFDELDIKYVNLQPLTPLPGTGIEVAPRDLLLAPGDFERWDLAHVTVRPTQMSVEDYYSELIRLYLRTLYKPRYLASYLKYPPRLLAKIIKGTWKVRAQYLDKLREAKRFG